MEEENKPSGKPVDAIGAKYDMTDLENIRCITYLHKKEKYVDIVREAQRELGSLISMGDLQRITGVNNLEARYFYNGAFVSKEIYECLQHTSSSEWDIQSISHE